MKLEVAQIDGSKRDNAASKESEEALQPRIGRFDKIRIVIEIAFWGDAADQEDDGDAAEAERN